MQNTVVSLEMLEETPSRKSGFSHRMEREIRISVCLYIRQATMILRLYRQLIRPINTAATAQVLIQRFFFTVSIDHIPLWYVIGAAVYLASKLEESPRRLREVITVMDYLYKRVEVCRIH
jgi:hypothetical protein